MNVDDTDDGCSGGAGECVSWIVVTTRGSGEK